VKIVRSIHDAVVLWSKAGAGHKDCAKSEKDWKTDRDEEDGLSAFPLNQPEMLMLFPCKAYFPWKLSVIACLG
jgi:hypothetical protein